MDRGARVKRRRNGKRLRGGAWNGGVYKGEVDGMLRLLLMLLV